MKDYALGMFVKDSKILVCNSSQAVGKLTLPLAEKVGNETLYAAMKRIFANEFAIIVSNARYSHISPGVLKTINGVVYGKFYYFALTEMEVHRGMKVPEAMPSGSITNFEYKTIAEIEAEYLKGNVDSLAMSAINSMRDQVAA
jgi:hypothetical protein